LELWQREIGLLIVVYDVTSDFIGDEKFVLISQMKSATNPYQLNISEGFRRKL